MTTDSEKITHERAKELEHLKWKLRKEELTYLEAGQHLRSLNQQLWQVPGMVIAITGGIWYGAISMPSGAPKAFAFIFAAFVNFLTIPVIWRLRKIIQIQIDIQIAFSEFKKGKLNKVVISCWIALLITAGVLSLAAADNSTSISNAKSTGEEKITNNYLYPQKIEIITK